MKFLKLGKALKEGWISFRRNKWLSIATISVLALSLYIIGSTLLAGLAIERAIKYVEGNVNVSVYFDTEVSNERIMEIKGEIEKNPIVTNVNFIDREDAFLKFSQDSENEEDVIIREALKELDSNPLLSSLVINANNYDDYDKVAEYVNENFNKEIHNVNYKKNKEVINKLGKMILSIRRIGVIKGVIFLLVSILFTFNAIRMSLYARKKEFQVMRLVGASNLYIKIPPIFEGMLYGFFGALSAIILVGAAAYSELTEIEWLISKENTLSFYLENAWIVAGVIILGGLFIGTISSMIAIRKYLKG